MSNLLPFEEDPRGWGVEKLKLLLCQPITPKFKLNVLELYDYGITVCMNKKEIDMDRKVNIV